MVDFTARQPLTDGTNRIIDDPATPSAIPGLLGLATGALDTYSNYKDSVAKDKAKKKSDEEAARKAAASAGVVQAIYGAKDDVTAQAASASAGTAQASAMDAAMGDDLVAGLAPGAFDIQSLDTATGKVFDAGVVQMNPAVQKQVTQSTTDISNYMAAVDQGRMPAISLKSAINGRIRRLFDQYPDQAEQILDMIGKTGAKDVVFAEIGDIVADINGERTRDDKQKEDDRSFRQSMKEAGMKGLGELAAIGGKDGGPMNDDELIAAGLRYSRQATELDIASRTAQLSLTNANLTEAQKKEANTTAQNDIVRVLMGDINNDAGPIIQISQQLSAAMVTDPTGADSPRWEALGVMANNAVNNWVSSAVNLAVQKGYTGDVNSLRSQFQNQFKGLLDNFTGDKSVAAANHRALQTMGDKMGINVQQALPVFMSLKAAGLNPNDMPGLMEGVARNPEMQAMLKKEITGFIPEFGQERASTRLMNIIKILRGEATLRELAPGEARAAITTLYPSSREFSKGYVRNLGVSSDSVLNTVGELAIATRALSPSSGASATRVAAGGLSNVDTRAALKKLAADPSADKAMVTATIQAVRAGNAQILNNVLLNTGKINKEYGQYYEMKWDNRNGKYYIDDSKKRAAIAQAQKGAPGGRMTGEDARFARMGGGLATANISNAPIPENMQKWMNAANESLDNITELGNLDPTTPRGNPLELRRFYGQNQPLKSQQPGDEAVAPSKERGKMFDTLEKGLQSITPDAVEVAPAGGGGGGNDYKANPRYAQYAPIVSNVAAKHGIPEPVLASLIQKETGYNSRPGPVITEGSHKGDRAMGLGQVMAKTAAKYLPRFGVTDRSQLNEEQQIELAAMVLADNKAAGGDWRDAVSRYFTGTSYRKALAQGRTDGYNSVAQYVEGVL